MVDEHDEPLFSEIHLSSSFHRGEALWAQNQIYERGETNSSFFLIIVITRQVFTGQYMTSVVLALPLVFYFNNRNKAFWTGMGQVGVQVVSL